MSAYKSRNPPAQIARQLRQEAGFGCALCGEPFVEYHHIVKWHERKHFDPEHMIAVCSTCHNRFHRMTLNRQYGIKLAPFNLRSPKAKGFLEFNSGLLKIILGGNIFENCPKIICSDDLSILSWRLEDGQFLLSLRMFGPSGKALLEIVDNQLSFCQQDFWDFDFKYNYVKVKSKSGGQITEIDLRKYPVTIKLSTFISGRRITIGPSSIVGIAGAGGTIRNCEFSNLNGYCFNFFNKDRGPSNISHGNCVFDIPL